MIKKLFENLKVQNRAALVQFITCGDPNIAFTKSLIKTVVESGVDIIELGVPFSDPMADGKAIQSASERALASGTNLSKIFDMVEELRSEGVNVPFVLFSYYNPIFKMGIELAAKRSQECRIDAWLNVDVPMEESSEIIDVIKKYGIDFIPLAAPTTPLERLEKISNNGSGFLYYITVSGVTGARNALPSHIAERLRVVKDASLLPVAAGFGISNPQMAHLAAMSADAVVIGSKFVTLVADEYLKNGEASALSEAAKFVKAMAAQMGRDD